MTTLPAVVTIVDLDPIPASAVVNTILFEVVGTVSGVAGSYKIALSQIATTAFGNLPPGGGTSQVLTKASGTDFAAQWSAVDLAAPAAVTGVLNTSHLQAFSVINGWLATPRLITATGSVTIATTDARVLFTTASAGTCTVSFPDATTANGPVLLKEIKGNISATAPIIATFSSGQLADGIATVTITTPYAEVWFNPLVLANGTTGVWYLTS